MSDTEQKNKKRFPRITYVLLLAAVILTLSAFYVGGTGMKTGQDNEVAASFLLLAAAGVGLASFLFSIFDIGAAKKGRRARRVLVMLVIPPIGCASLYLGYVAFLPKEPVAQQEVTAASSELPALAVQDPAIVALLQSVGAKGDYSDLTIRWAGGDMQAECGWADAGGCYSPNTNQLIVKQGLEPSYQRLAIAHEFLHYVWHKHQLDQDRHLNSYLIDFYGKNPTLRQRVASHYVDSGGLNGTEIFSYGCTEASDARLGGYIVSKCNEFIDTSTLTAYY